MARSLTSSPFSSFEGAEAYFGKRIVNIIDNPATLNKTIVFDDKTAVSVDVYGAFEDYNNISFEPLENYGVCVSCGEKHEAGYYDSQNRCYQTLKKRWGKIRKVFWARYSKTGKIPK